MGFRFVLACTVLSVPALNLGAATITSGTIVASLAGTAVDVTGTGGLSIHAGLDAGIFDIPEGVPFAPGAVLSGGGSVSSTFNGGSLAYDGLSFTSLGVDAGMNLTFTGTPFSVGPGTINLPFTASGQVNLDLPAGVVLIPLSGSGQFVATFIGLSQPDGTLLLHAIPNRVTYTFTPEPGTGLLSASVLAAIAAASLSHLRANRNAAG